MSYIEVYRTGRLDEGYEHRATVYDDGTVDGDSIEADHFRDIIQRLADKGYSPADYFPEYIEVVDTRYNTGMYRAVVTDG